MASKHDTAADQDRTHIQWPGTRVVKPASPKKVVPSTVVKKLAPPFPKGAVFHPYLDSTPPEYNTIRALQQQLKDRGWNVEVDGRYGPGLRRAVVAFQKSHGLKADGLIGEKTWASVFTSPLGG